MIKELKIENFKSFHNETVEFGNLTLLTGLNSTGKSTIITSLLLPLQIESSRKLNLNGDYFNLGTFGDLFYQWATNDMVSLSYNFNLETIKVELKYTEAKENDNVIYDDSLNESVRNISERIKYISAERLAPDLFYKKVGDAKDKNSIGVKGQNAISVLAECKNIEIENLDMIHPDASKYGAEERSLLANVNAWMDKISPGVTISAESLSKAGISTLEFGYKNESIMKPVSSVNVGFGLTHTLPVILKALLASKGDIFIVENPEAHLHPAGQTHIGLFLAKLAKSGVQVVIESHSDHVFNGIRLAIKNKLISNDEAKIHFFTKEESGERSNFKVFSKKNRVAVSEKGKLTDAPQGFFDEWEEALYKLL